MKCGFLVHFHHEQKYFGKTEGNVKENLCKARIRKIYVKQE
jgi:hypothetical protein